MMMVVVVACRVHGLGLPPAHAGRTAASLHACMRWPLAREVNAVPLDVCWHVGVRPPPSLPPSLPPPAPSLQHHAWPVEACAGGVVHQRSAARQERPAPVQVGGRAGRGTPEAVAGRALYSTRTHVTCRIGGLGWAGLTLGWVPMCCRAFWSGFDTKQGLGSGGYVLRSSWGCSAKKVHSCTQPWQPLPATTPCQHAVQCVHGCRGAGSERASGNTLMAACHTAHTYIINSYSNTYVGRYDRGISRKQVGHACMAIAMAGGMAPSPVSRLRTRTYLRRSDDLSQLRQSSIEWVFGLTGKAGSCMYMAPVRACVRACVAARGQAGRGCLAWPGEAASHLASLPTLALALALAAAVWRRLLRD